MQETAQHLVHRKDDWCRHDFNGQLKNALGPAARAGMAYRWGVAVVSERPCDELHQVLSRYACDSKIPKSFRDSDWQRPLRAWQDRVQNTADLMTEDAVLAITVAASLPKIQNNLSGDELASLVALLFELHHSAIQNAEVSSLIYLLLGGELGWHLHLLLISGRKGDASRSSLGGTARGAFLEWCQHEIDSVSCGLQGANGIRVVLASLVRCKKLGLLRGASDAQKQNWKSVGKTVANWVLTLSRHQGLAAFSSLDPKAVKDDRVTDGLLDQAVKFDRGTLGALKKLIMGCDTPAAPLSTDSTLPESMVHDARSKIVVMLPKWGARRARLNLDYQANQVRCELFHGKGQMIKGYIENNLQISGVNQYPTSGWDEVCEYTDKDVHYLEIEQDWSGGVVLQRQFVLVRKDQCVLFSDAILPKEKGGKLGEINYQCRIPLRESESINVDQEVRELFFGTRKRRAMGIPLAAPEWRVGPSECDLNISADHHLVMSASGNDRLFSPIWFDFARRRFSRKRTWRQLTVVDQLRIVEPCEAVGYRIQVGSEQWMVYRSLHGQRTRTVLGKHLIADFYCAKFNPSDGNFKEIITVDDGID